MGFWSNLTQPVSSTMETGDAAKSIRWPRDKQREWECTKQQRQYKKINVRWIHVLERMPLPVCGCGWSQQVDILQEGNAISLLCCRDKLPTSCTTARATYEDIAGALKSHYGDHQLVVWSTGPNWRPGYSRAVSQVKISQQPQSGRHTRALAGLPFDFNKRKTAHVLLTQKWSSTFSWAANPCSTKPSTRWWSYRW
jgi:hypothetical protein